MGVGGAGRGGAIRALSGQDAQLRPSFSAEEAGTGGPACRAKGPIRAGRARACAAAGLRAGAAAEAARMEAVVFIFSLIDCCVLIFLSVYFVSLRPGSQGGRGSGPRACRAWGEGCVPGGLFLGAPGPACLHPAAPRLLQALPCLGPGSRHPRGPCKRALHTQAGPGPLWAALRLPLLHLLLFGAPSPLFSPGVWTRWAPPTRP